MGIARRSTSYHRPKSLITRRKEYDADDVYLAHWVELMWAALLQDLKTLTSNKRKKS